MISRRTLTQSNAAAYAGLTLTALFWASNAVIARGVSGEIPPVMLSFCRWLLALVILLPIGLPRLRGHWPVVRRHWAMLTLLGGLSVGLFNTLLYLAAHTTTALNITLFIASMPIMVTLLSRLALHTPISTAQTLGIAAAFTGMALIIAKASLGTLLALDFRLGDLIMLGAVGAWALFTVLMRRAAIPLDGMGFLTVQVGLGLALIFPFLLLEAIFVDGGLPSADMIGPIAYVAVFPGLLAFTFWNHGVHRVGPPRAAMFIYLMPLFGALLGGLFLGERLQGFHLAGGVLILAGLWLATRASGQKSNE